MQRLSLPKRPDFALGALLPAISAGLVIGVMEVFVEISFAAMIFSGALSDFIAQGVGILIFGALIFAIVIPLASSFPNSIAGPQDAPVAILAVVVAAIAVNMPEAPPDQIFATAVAAMMLSTVLTGITFWLMGRFNLGNLVRFIPYPVIGGFLAGAGWLLVVGGIGVMTDAPLSTDLLQPAVLIRWLPGLLFAGALLVLLRRYTHFLVLPTVFLASIGLFYLVYFLTHGTVATAGAEGWLLGGVQGKGLWHPMLGPVFNLADWASVWGNAIDLSTIGLIGAISLLLNASGLELVTREDGDLNQELKASGIANILAGLGGSAAGYHALSSSALGYRLAGRSRLPGLISALVLGFALLVGANVLSVFPKLIAGGFLIFLGLDFLVEWIYEAWFKLPKTDYLLIWLILITVATLGFLQGVAVGIVVAVILFVINYSRTGIIRHALHGADYQSHVMRPRLYTQLLAQRGDAIQILELQGFIFFGTAHRMVEQIQARIDAADLPRLHYLLLDFRLVTGVDSSAMLSFSKLSQLLTSREIELVLTHMAPAIATQLGRATSKREDGSPAPHIFTELNQGLAWCEEQVIANFADIGLSAKPQTLLEYLDAMLPNPNADTDWMDHLNPLANPQAKLATTPNLERLLTFVERLEVAHGACILREGQVVEGIYFVEAGQVIAQTAAIGEQVSELTVMETGTAFGEIGIYTQQRATATVIASAPSVLYYLSAENLTRMDTEDPELAIAIHRLIADILGRKLTQATHTLRTLQN